MGWLDLVPRTPGLYIGGLYALYQPNLIQDARITHVLSVIDYDPLLQDQFAHLKHFHIRAEDDPNVNLLQYFEQGVRFIDGALGGEEKGGGKSGEESDGKEGGGCGGVFVHCAMGKSRSATLVIAYLMWKFNIDSTTALAQLCEGRPVCDPNAGFKEQLEVWGRMCGEKSEAAKRKIYDEWEKGRFVGDVWEWEKRGAGRSRL
jgi:dual specificity phosphatase 12